MVAGLTSLSRRRSVRAGTPGPQLDAVGQRVPHGFDAVGEALASGRSPVSACAVAGRTLARDGASLGEALSGLAATCAALGGAAPDFGSTHALAVAWSEATLEFLHDQSCEDPLTGLASIAHLRTRLAEVYREGESAGFSVRFSHALVVVDLRASRWAARRLAEGRRAPFARALRLAAVAEAVRVVFSGEETVARVGRDRVAMLVRRTPELGETVEALRELLVDVLGDVPGSGEDAERIVARLWIEGLPGRSDTAVRLLSELAR